jgi:hypothetical protein
MGSNCRMLINLSKLIATSRANSPASRLSVSSTGSSGLEGGDEVLANEDVRLIESGVEGAVLNVYSD